MVGTAHAKGAYGFRITGVDVAVPPFNHVADDAPEITVLLETSTARETAREVGVDRVVMPLLGGGAVRMVRTPPGAILATPQPLTPEALAHPYLAPIAAAHASWRGWLAIHGGGIVVGGVIWGVTGPRNSGKSSFLAACAARGIPVVADDLMVIDGDIVHPGPRSVDLRPDAAEQLGLGSDIGVVGNRPRFRLELPPVEGTPSFAGWIFLAWGPDISMSEVAAGDRVRRLRPKNAVPGLPPHPTAFLRSVGKPCFSLHRPRAWAYSAAAVDQVVEQLG